VNAVFIVPSLSEASARVRVRQALPCLESEGVRGDLREIPARSGPRWAFFRDLKKAEVVVLHRKLFNFLEFAFLRRHTRRLVFDFDDAVMFRDSFRRNPFSRRRARRFLNTVRKADGVVAGNLYLKDRALDAGAPGEVRIIPSAVDPSAYPESSPTREGGLVLGWIGQHSTLPYLEDVLPALEDLSRTAPGLSLRVISDRFPHSEGLRIDAQIWSEGEEGELLRPVDIGLMPLRDDPWSKGKCGYKILQFFASGKPVVASPVGVNRELVEPGVTGLWAENPGDWAEAVTALAGDASRRAAMGAEGRRYLEAGGYTLEAYASHLGAFLRGLA
jgi:glycosyltransferase involved in cell wall biosynthesis